MEQSLILRAGELFPGSDIVRKFSFKMIIAWDMCALLAREIRNIVMGFSVSKGESARFLINDCFGCLSPLNITA